MPERSHDTRMSLELANEDVFEDDEEEELESELVISESDEEEDL